MRADGWINGETNKTERTIYIYMCDNLLHIEQITYNNAFILPYNNNLVKVSALTLRIYKMEANKKNACASNER
jgi:hypothetical protein